MATHAAVPAIKPIGRWRAGSRISPADIVTPYQPS